MRFLLTLLAAIAGYIAFAVAGALLIGAVSDNTHDLSMEATMTGAFMIGPIGAIVGAVLGFRRAGRGRAV